MKHLHISRMHGLFSCFLLACVMVASACSKQESQIFDPVPFIRLTDIQPSILQEFQEKVVISIEYRDGDGDLGDYDPNVYSLEVLDRRLSEADFYHIHPLAPEAAEVSIEGVFSIELKNTFVLGNAQEESVTYEIRLRDRSGNWSNVITSPPIVVHK